MKHLQTFIERLSSELLSDAGNVALGYGHNTRSANLQQWASNSACLEYMDFIKNKYSFDYLKSENNELGNLIILLENREFYLSYIEIIKHDSISIILHFSIVPVFERNSKKLPMNAVLHTSLRLDISMNELTQGNAFEFYLSGFSNIHNKSIDTIRKEVDYKSFDTYIPSIPNGKTYKELSRKEAIMIKKFFIEYFNTNEFKDEYMDYLLDNNDEPGLYQLLKDTFKDYNINRLYRN